jgi:serine protease Do
VKPGDTIVKVDGVAVKDTRDLIGYVSGKAPGSKVQLGVVRDGREVNLTASLAERKDETADKGGDPEKTASQDSHERIGIQVSELTPQMRQMQRIKADVDGLVVMRVKEVSAASDAGIQEGDIITQVNGQKVGTTEDFGKVVGKAKKGDILKLYVYNPRANVSRFALVKIAD